MEQTYSTQATIDAMTAAYEAKMRTTARQKIERQLTETVEQLMVLQGSEYCSRRQTKIATLIETMKLVRQDIDDLSSIVY